jgi:hypothetical protein
MVQRPHSPAQYWFMKRDASPPVSKLTRLFPSQHTRRFSLDLKYGQVYRLCQ